MAFDAAMWEDKVDEGRLNKYGTYLLYRFRWKDGLGDKAKNTILSNGHDNYPPFKDDEPVAWGFTAFLFVGLPGNQSFYFFLSEHDTALDVDFYTQYYNFSKDWFARFASSESSPSDTHSLEVEFLLDHIKDESEKLIESERFFTETHSESDRVIKLKIKSKASEYISFLNEKIELLSVEPHKGIEINSLAEIATTSSAPPSGLSTMEELEELFFPLTFQKEDEIPCIEVAFKTYLIDSLITLVNDGKFSACPTLYKVRNKKLFYSVLTSWKKRYTPSDIFKIQDFEVLISRATGINPKTIKNNTVSTKAH